MESSSHSLSIKNIPIGYIKELEYIEKSKTDQQENIREVSKISQDQLPPMPENQHLHLITTSIQNHG